MNTIDPRKKFINLIDLEKSRVFLAPHITFICGGPVDISLTTNHSVRNMFMNLSGRLPDKTEGFTLAENFKNWKDGYKSLSDFENDIAALSSLVVVILESAGALAELGLFYANETIRKKMLIIVHREYYESESFIKFGFLNPIEKNNFKAVKVYEISEQKIDTITENEVQEIVADVIDYSEDIDKSSDFKSDNRGHLIFLIYQLVDLFTIVTFDEITDMLDQMEVSVQKSELRSALFILEKFKLLTSEKKSSSKFYFAPVNKADRVDFTFKRFVSPDGKERRYDSLAIKAEVMTFYRESMPVNPSMRRRLAVIARLNDE